MSLLLFYSRPYPPSSFGDGVSYPTRCSTDVEDGMMESLLGADSRQQEFEFVNETDNFLANTQ